MGTTGTVLATLSAPGGTLNVGTDWDVTTFTSNNGTVAFTGTGTIYTSTGFYNLTKSTGGTTTYNTGAALSVANNLTVNTGTLVLVDIAGTQTVTGNVSGTGTLNASAVASGHVLTVGGYVGTSGTTLATLSAPVGTLNVGGDMDVVTSFTNNNGSVVFDGATAASVNGLTFYDLTINKSALANTVTSTGNWTVTHVLTLTSGTWQAGTSTTHTIAGNWDSATGGANFSFSAGTSTIVLSPTANPNITTKGLGTDPFYNLTLSSGGTLQSDAQANNNVSITAGVLALNSSVLNHNLTVGANLTGNALTASGSENINVGGNLTLTTFSTSSRTVIMNSATTPVSITVPGITFCNLTIDKGGVLASTVNLSNDITITASLTIKSGTLSAGTHTIHMNGSLWDDAGNRPVTSPPQVSRFDPGTGQVIFMPTSTTVTIKGSNDW